MAEATDGTGIFDVGAIAAALPDSAATLLADTYLTDRPAASARVFRVYRPTPAHYHETCDEYLYCLSGRRGVRVRQPGGWRPGDLHGPQRWVVRALEPEEAPSGRHPDEEHGEREERRRQAGRRSDEADGRRPG